MISYTTDEQDQARADGDPWIEFQRSDDLSTGLYVLDVGEVDTQDPHTEDEIYVCVSGRARFVTPSSECEVGSGTIIFVPAREEHRFVDVIERLQLVVVFGPAEGSRA